MPYAFSPGTQKEEAGMAYSLFQDGRPCLKKQQKPGNTGNRLEGLRSALDTLILDIFDMHAPESFGMYISYIQERGQGLTYRLEISA